MKGTMSMPSFKRYLHEEARDFTTKRDVENWLNNKGIFSYTVNEDLTVDSDKNVDLLNKGIYVLPVKFRKISGAFNIAFNHLESLRGCPEEVFGNFRCRNNLLQSFEGAPKYVGKDFLIGGNPRLTSLHDIYKHVKQIDGMLIMDTKPIKDSILGLLMIRGLKEVDDGDSHRPHTHTQPFIILNTYLPNTTGKDAVYECQEELIDAGFEKFAKL